MVLLTAKGKKIKTPQNKMKNINKNLNPPPPLFFFWLPDKLNLYKIFFLFVMKKTNMYIFIFVVRIF